MLEHRYEDTMIDVKKYADKVGIPYRQWLMDSWWYFKGTGDGVKNWTAMPSIFPNGIDYVFDNTGNMPIVAHNRYWSANTDYAKQNGGEFDFIIEPDSHQGLAMPTEQRFWDYLMSSSLEWGLKVYEQDWLYNEFSEMNCKFEREAREFKVYHSLQTRTQVLWKVQHLLDNGWFRWVQLPNETALRFNTA